MRVGGPQTVTNRAHDVRGIHALYPQGRFPQPKLRAFVDYLADHFRGTAADDWPS